MIGVTLGLQNEITNATNIFIGIALHASLVGFVVSITTLRIWLKLPNMSLMKCVMIQCVMCLFRPLGICLGMMVGNLNGSAERIISAILTSLSAGIFLHVTFLSLIPAEFSTDKNHSANHCSSNQTTTKQGSKIMTKDEHNCDDNLRSGESSMLSQSFNKDTQIPNLSQNMKLVFFVLGWMTLSLLMFLH